VLAGALVWLMVWLMALPSARADHVVELGEVLRISNNLKKRINAAVALGRLHDQRGVRPLVWALRKDRSELVRGIAAASLGHIGDARALPALKKAQLDADPSVRKRAGAAVELIMRKADERAVANGTLAGSEMEERAHRYRIAAREAPRVDLPKVYVHIKTVSDKTKGPTTKQRRELRAERMLDLMVQELRATPHVTTDPTQADDLGIRRFTVDVTIEKLDRQDRGPWVEMVCQVRLSVSNDRGRMLSFLTGGATVQVPKKTFRIEYETQLGAEALENAAKGIHQDLIAYLDKELRE
jgi:hypothetical protein